jgi:DNA-binding transcriptional regulator LsrR (DeoR family)
MPAERNEAHSNLDLLVRAAESYYLENKTQAQIADLLGISTSTVSRLLSRARDEGIVRIAIVRPVGRRSNLEQALRRQFGLREAIVVGVPASAANTEIGRHTIATAAAPAIDALIKPGLVVGIGRGRSLAALATALQPLATPRFVTIVQVMGEDVSRQSPTRSAELARLLAEMYAGTSHFLNAPALVDDSALAELLLRTPGVSEILPLYDRLDIMLVGVGPLRGSALDRNGLLHPAQIDHLEAAGALGDICGHFFADDGRFVDAAYPGRAIGISEEQFRRCPCIVAVAGGQEKVRPLCALVAARMVHVLVTDESTALQILDSH